MKGKKQTAGFTLVELIVVIAILGILAGVGTVGYSGYITKANQAADEQLLSSLNTAFAAACMANGENNYGRRDVSVQMTDAEGGKEAAVAVSGIAGFNDDFNSFYEGGVFKVLDNLFYNKTLGGFDVDVVMAFDFGGKSITLSSKDVAVLSGDNAFSDRGSAKLLTDVGTLETYLAKDFLDDGILDEIGASDDFMNAFAGYLGLKAEDYEDGDAYLAAYEAKLTELETTNPNATTNALIMYAASNAANATEEQIGKLFTGTVTSNIEVKNADGTRNNEATMANAALAYGMYTAYLQQNPDIDSTNSDNEFVKLVNTTEFITYCASTQGQSDLEAYQAAMNMISDNTGNSEITSSILESGITGNSDLAELMQDIMGS